jgi:HK97 family phage prohead protease
MAAGLHHDLARSLAAGEPLTAAAVGELRAALTTRAWQAWTGDAVHDWAVRIGETVDMTRDIPTMADEPAEPSQPALYGVDADALADKIMAADAAMDAAQTLLEAYEDKDATVSQAYYLICAADSALGDVQDLLGLVDPDDEINEGETPTDMPTDMPAETTYSWTPDMEARWQQLRGVAPEVDLEARRGAIAGADRRTFSSEVRAAKQSDGTVRMSGYAAMWDREADGLPFREVIKRGAFADSLGRGDDVFLLVNHDTDQLPLARRSAGTLSVAEDDMGLHVTAELDPANPRAAELASALERGDVDKMSFAFRVAADGSTKTEDGVRELRALDLYEVSVVTWPAYNATSVGLRSADDDLHLRWKRAHLRAKSRAL